MNNAQYFKSGKRLLDAFRLLVETCKAERVHAEMTMPELADFAVCNHVSTALHYAIGEIVQFKDGNGIRYGIVRNYGRDHGYPLTSRNCIEIGNGISLTVPADDPEQYKTHIPQELLDLAKREIADLAKREIAESNLLKTRSLP